MITGGDEVCILPPPTLLKKGWVYPLLSISLSFFPAPSRYDVRRPNNFFDPLKFFRPPIVFFGGFLFFGAQNQKSAFSAGA